MKQIIVDIMILTNEFMKKYDLHHKYRVKAYSYDTKEIITYGINEDDIQDYEIGKIIRRS